MAQPPETDANGPSRRTILAGSVWSVPVIATAIAIPVTAATVTGLVLNFEQPVYEVAGCSLLETSVLATLDGEAAPGRSVTVTLPPGYTFESGSSTYTGVTDGEGILILPVILLPSGAGLSTIAATSGGTNAVATINNVGATDSYAQVYYPNGPGSGWRGSYPAVPSGSQSLGGFYFQAPNGDIYRGNTVIVSGADAGAEVLISASGQTMVSFLSSTGVATWLTLTSSGFTTSTYPSVPAGSTPLGGVYFQAPNGDIYRGNTVIASGAEPGAVLLIDNAGASHVSYVSSAGVATRWTSGPGGTLTHPSVPAGSTPLGGVYFQAPNGDIYRADTVSVPGAAPGASVILNTAGSSVLGYLLETPASSCG